VGNVEEGCPANLVVLENRPPDDPVTTDEGVSEPANVLAVLFGEQLFGLPKTVKPPGEAVWGRGGVLALPRPEDAGLQSCSVGLMPVFAGLAAKQQNLTWVREVKLGDFLC